MAHQRQFHDCQTRYLVAVCGRQVGKTVACVNELVKRAIKKPASRNWYITNDYRQAKRNVWNLLLRYTPKEIIASTNVSELSVILVNGSRIELIGVENAEKLRGAVVDFMILDEYADFPRHVWPEILMPMMSTTNGGAWFIGTPKGMGNDLYDKYFLSDPEFAKFRFPACELRGNQVVKPLSTFASLEFLQKAYDTSDPDAFRQEYLAEFTRPTGTVYKEWNLDHFVPLAYDASLPLHISFDWGINDPTSLIWIQPHGSETRVVDYYEASNANIEHFIALILSKPYKPADLYTGDPAGKARTLTTGTSVIDLLSDKGIFVRTKDGVRIPDQIRLTHAKIPGLYVSDKLIRFRDCLLNYRYPAVKDQARNQENELPIHDEFSHAMRALEYWAINADTAQPLSVNPPDWVSNLPSWVNT
jgi:hypothetical protein